MAADPALRMVRLVLTTPDGRLCGQLPAFPAALPWWQEAESLVQAARDTFGIEVTVLRLLSAAQEAPHGGLVTYLAEVALPVAGLVMGLAEWPAPLADDPMLADYARPGGPARALDWARQALAGQGIGLQGAPVQIRSWNLSALWRLPVAGGAVWLKVVPGFFAHESVVLTLLSDAAVPRLLAAEGGRMLLAEVPGEDQYQALGPQLARMITLLVGIQRRFLGQGKALVARGLPDFRGAALRDRIADVVLRTQSALPAGAAGILAGLIETLPERFAAVADCGLPEGLIHGDFHPGNLRGQGDEVTLLDWADSGVGHPLLDQPAFLSAVPIGLRASLAAHWAAEWQSAVPGSDPARAAALLAPVAAARQAVVYQRFLDQIARSEHPYHQADPALWLARTARLLQDAAI